MDSKMEYIKGAKFEEVMSSMKAGHEVWTVECDEDNEPLIRRADGLSESQIRASVNHDGYMGILRV